MDEQDETEISFVILAPYSLWSSQDSVETRTSPPVLCFKSLRADATDVAVSPGSIVERLDVVGDVFGGDVAIVVNVLLDSFLLQAAEEGFR